MRSSSSQSSSGRGRVASSASTSARRARMILQPLLQLRDRRIAVGQRLLSSHAALEQLRAVRACASVRCPSSPAPSGVLSSANTSSRAVRAAPPARAARARRAARAALALGLEFGPLHIQPRQVLRPQLPVRRARACQARPRRVAHLARTSACSVSMRVAAQTAALRQARLQRFELAAQFGVLAVRTLNARLRWHRAAASARRDLAAQRAISCSSCRTRASAGAQLLAQRLEAMFALEHAGMHVAAAIDAQPVPPEPFAASGDRATAPCATARARRSAVGQRRRRHARAASIARTAPGPRTFAASVPGGRRGGRRRRSLEEGEAAGVQRVGSAAPAAPSVSTPTASR